jgi:hypothetical protein
MGRYNSVTGTAVGKVSSAVFYRLNGQEVIRGIGEKRKFKSKKVFAQNDSLRLLMNFFSKVKPFIKAGFKNEAAGTIRNYHNIATSYNRIHAIEIIDHVPELHYDKVLLSRGHALPAQNPKVTLTQEGLTFNWDSIPDLSWSSNQDQAMTLVWFPVMNEAFFNTAGARRLTATDQLNLPASLLTEKMEIYIAFVSEDRESVSDSIYLGSLNS